MQLHIRMIGVKLLLLVLCAERLSAITEPLFRAVIGGDVSEKDDEFRRGLVGCRLAEHFTRLRVESGVQRLRSVAVVKLKRKLMRYIRQYNKAPKPVKWKYFDPSR